MTENENLTFTDCIGMKVEVGDYVVYPVRRSSSMRMKLGYVYDIETKETRRGETKIAKIRKPTVKHNFGSDKDREYKPIHTTLSRLKRCKRVSLKHKISPAIRRICEDQMSFTEAQWDELHDGSFIVD